MSDSLGNALGASAVIFGLIFISIMIIGSIAGRISDWRKERKRAKWKERVLKSSPLCKGCDADYHCSVHKCHCENEVTVNGNCLTCSCDYNWCY